MHDPYDSTEFNKDFRSQLDIDLPFNGEELLQKIVAFLADNVGNPTSSNSIANSLVSEKRIENIKKIPATSTVESYIGALEKAFVFYEAKRYDLKGKNLQKTLGKYYIVDAEFRRLFK